MQILNWIKSKYNSAVVTRCSEKGCELKLNGLRSCVALKGEVICQDRKICDYIIFKINNTIIIGIVELKSKTAHPGEIEEKLTNGSKIALNILTECNNSSAKYKFYFLVLHKGLGSSGFRALSNRKITVEGKRCNLVLKRCGVAFSDVIL